MEKNTIHTEMLADECAQAVDKDVIEDPSCRNVPVVHKHLASVHETFACSTPMAICFSDLSVLLSFWHIYEWESSEAGLGNSGGKYIIIQIWKKILKALDLMVTSATRLKTSN